MQTPRFTILTTTYNRAHTLGALAASLEAQTEQDFEWLVVDDGSSDGTGELLKALSLSWGDKLRFEYRTNGGKHRALNYGMSAARGRWIFIVDSDDRLPTDALEKASRLIAEADAEPDCAGIMGLRVDPEGGVLGERLPDDVRFMDAASLTYRRGIRGDKAELFKAEVLRSFPFPEFEGETFITECVVWYRIARSGKTLLVTNDVLYVCDYQGDGLSAKSLELRVRNPEGTLLFYREALDLDIPFPGLLREAINLMRFSILARRSPVDEILKLSRRRWIPVLGLMPALVLAFWDKRSLGGYA
jgi:glycosyltransferase involved in cell wall biosynthesis